MFTWAEWPPRLDNGNRAWVPERPFLATGRRAGLGHAPRLPRQHPMAKGYRDL